MLALGIYRLLVDDVGFQPRLCNGSGVLEVDSCSMKFENKGDGRASEKALYPVLVCFRPATF